MHYTFPGNARYQERPFPKPALLNPATRKQLGLTSHADVIAHFTGSLLGHDGIGFVQESLKVEKTAVVTAPASSPPRVSRRRHGSLQKCTSPLWTKRTGRWFRPKA